MRPRHDRFWLPFFASFLAYAFVLAAVLQAFAPVAKADPLAGAVLCSVHGDVQAPAEEAPPPAPHGATCCIACPLAAAVPPGAPAASARPPVHAVALPARRAAPAADLRAAVRGLPPARGPPEGA